MKIQQSAHRVSRTAALTGALLLAPVLLCRHPGQRRRALRTEAIGLRHAGNTPVDR